VGSFQKKLQAIHELHEREYPIYITEFIIADWDAKTIGEK
jgi:hypothetical protein